MVLRLVSMSLQILPHNLHHRKVTLFWPQANREVQCFMVTLNKAARAMQTVKTASKVYMNSYVSTRPLLTRQAVLVPAFCWIDARWNCFLRFCHTKCSNTSTLETEMPFRRTTWNHADTRNYARPIHLDVSDAVLVKQQAMRECERVISKFNGTSTPKRPYSAKTGLNSQVTSWKKSSNEQGNAHYGPRPAKVAG